MAPPSKPLSDPPVSDPPAKRSDPGTPRIFEAATVVLLRPAPDQGPSTAHSGGASSGGLNKENQCPFEVCMVRRSSKSQFMPDAVVFPGGRVDPQDAKDDPEQRFVQAAVREGREEVHVDLDPQDLHWFDTWKTPSGEGPKRFLARFFLAYIDYSATQALRADEYETHDLQWAHPKQFLAWAEQKQLILAPPTYCVLRDLLRQGPDILQKRGAKTCSEIVLPKVRGLPSTSDHAESAPTREIVMPHHPDYPSLEGDSATAPKRLLGQPQSFRYEAPFYVPQP